MRLRARWAWNKLVRGWRFEVRCITPGPQSRLLSAALSEPFALRQMKTDRGAVLFDVERTVWRYFEDMGMATMPGVSRRTYLKLSTGTLMTEARAEKLSPLYCFGVQNILHRSTQSEVSSQACSPLRSVHGL